MSENVLYKENEEKVKYKCRHCGYEFDKYEQVSVFWSGDKLDVCPKCHKSPWEK